MEKLQKDLFKDTAIEETKKHIAGICISQLGGGSYCRSTSGWVLVDCCGG